MHGVLTSILDPEEANAQAFADQAVLLERYGGAEAVMAMPSFNHHTDSLLMLNRAFGEANGTPLSVRMASGSPYSLQMRSNVV